MPILSTVHLYSYLYVAFLKSPEMRSLKGTTFTDILNNGKHIIISKLRFLRWFLIRANQAQWPFCSIVVGLKSRTVYLTFLFFFVLSLPIFVSDIKAKFAKYYDTTSFCLDKTYLCANNLNGS